MKKTIVAICTLLSSNIAFSACPPILPSSSFFSAMDNAVKGAAAGAQSKIDLSIITNVEQVIKDKTATVSEELAESLTNSAMQISNTSYKNTLEAMTQLMSARKEYNSQRQNYRAMLENRVSEAESGQFFDDKNGVGGNIDKGSSSYLFAKAICKKNKLANKLMSPAEKTKRKFEAEKEQAKTELESTKFANANSLSRKKQLNHYEKYCSSSDKKRGFCEEVGLIPNGDIDFTISSAPKNESGSKKIDDTYISIYTMSNDEASAFNDYINNVIRYDAYSSLNNTEKTNPSEYPEVISVYQQDLASLNLAKHVFDTYKSKRVSINNEGAKMSELEVLNYMIEKYSNPEEMAAVLSSKEKGKKMHIYYLLSIINKIKIDKKELLDLNNSLQVAIVTKQINGSKYYEMMNKLKK